VYNYADPTLLSQLGVILPSLGEHIRSGNTRCNLLYFYHISSLTQTLTLCGQMVYHLPTESKSLCERADMMYTICPQSPDFVLILITGSRLLQGTGCVASLPRPALPAPLHHTRESNMSPQGRRLGRAAGLCHSCTH